jgi:hypothetical protein
MLDTLGLTAGRVNFFLPGKFRALSKEYWEVYLEVLSSRGIKPITHLHLLQESRLEELISHPQYMLTVSRTIF